MRGRLEHRRQQDTSARRSGHKEMGIDETIAIEVMEIKVIPVLPDGGRLKKRPDGGNDGDCLRKAEQGRNLNQRLHSWSGTSEAKGRECTSGWTILLFDDCGLLRILPRVQHSKEMDQDLGGRVPSISIKFTINDGEKFIITDGRPCGRFLDQLRSMLELWLVVVGVFYKPQHSD